MFNWQVKNAVFRLLHPLFWIQTGRTDWKYDAWLRKLLEQPIKVRDPYIAEVGNTQLWIKNYPYCFGCLFGEVGCDHIRLPAPITRYELKKKVEAQINGV